jgi:peptidyl-prolyl cis-trans isomerase SurA
MKKIAAIILLFSSLFIGNQVYAKPAEQSLDQMAAVVNDDVITASELNEAMAKFKTQLANAHVTPPADDVFRKQVLDQLINKKLQLQIAKQIGLVIKPKDIDTAIEMIAKQNNLSASEMYDHLAEEGISKKDYRDEIADQIIMQKLQQQEVASKINVSKDEVTSYINSRSWKANGAKEYHLQDILIPLSDAPSSTDITAAYKRAQAVFAKLKQGTSIQQVTQAEGTGANALQAGDLGWRKLGDMPGAFAEQVNHMQPNDLAGPLQTPNGFHVIRLDGIRDGAPAKAPDKKEVEEVLFQQKFAIALQNWLSKIRGQAYIITNPSGK